MVMFALGPQAAAQASAVSVGTPAEVATIDAGKLKGDRDAEIAERAGGWNLDAELRNILEAELPLERIGDGAVHVVLNGQDHERRCRGGRLRVCTPMIDYLSCLPCGPARHA